MTEVLEKGKNEHFRTAADFMKYFESLYPASDALTKQVQRAIRSLNMPKDELGYFIPNKTAEQLEQEQELTYIFKKANADVCRMDDYQPLFLKADDAVSSYMLSRITDSPLFQGKYLTAHTVPGGILFYTKNPNQLEIHAEELNCQINLSSFFHVHNAKNDNIQHGILSFFISLYYLLRLLRRLGLLFICRNCSLRFLRTSRLCRII